VSIEKSEKPLPFALKFIIFAAVVLFVITFTYSVVANLKFKNQVVAVMTINAAKQIGLYQKDEAQSPFGPRRVWIAKGSDGSFEYKYAWPVIGLAPLSMFGGGEVIGQDIIAECKRLSDNECQLITVGS
jgi:hypothetical protein